MKTYMHPDYWCKVPAGEVQLGISSEQRQMLWKHLRERLNYDKRSSSEQAAIDQILDLVDQGKHLSLTQKELIGLYFVTPLRFAPARTIFIDRFYIARFALTSQQALLYRKGQDIFSVPGVLEQPEFKTRQHYVTKEEITYRARTYERASPEIRQAICKDIGGHIPKAEEWEKAARGPESLLYPWGNEWDEQKGYFYSEQETVNTNASVDGYPGGVSPYGVWGMVDGIPEAVIESIDTYYDPIAKEYWGNKAGAGTKGRRARNTLNEEDAFIVHLPALPGKSTWDAFRPVLDRWPQTQWRGAIETSIGTNGSNR